MHKLKLETLQVESFATSEAEGRASGTVRGHMDVATGVGPVQPATLAGHCIPTYDVRNCGPTQYFDCTFGCSLNTFCKYCAIEADPTDAEVK